MQAACQTPCEQTSEPGFMQNKIIMGRLSLLALTCINVRLSSKPRAGELPYKIQVESQESAPATTHAKQHACTYGVSFWGERS